MTRTLIFWKPSRLTTRFIDDIDSMGSTCQTSHQPRVNFFPHTDLNTGSKSDRRMLTNPAQAVDCGPSTALSEILLFPSQSSPFPILRDQSLLAPEYHREYGRVQGFNPRDVSQVHSGLAWRRLRGHRSAWATSPLPFPRPLKQHRLPLRVDLCGHQPQRYRFPTWYMESECHPLLLVACNRIRLQSLTAAQNGLRVGRIPAHPVQFSRLGILRHESCLLPERLIGFEDAERVWFGVLLDPGDDRGHHGSEIA